jgi:proteic killer suppression protein
VIKAFSDKSTAAIFAGKFVKTLPHEIQLRARERLDQVHAAVVVDDLRLPPSNQLEALKGVRKGQWSVRINLQWRVCFRFQAGNAFDVEITDYH